MQELLNEHIIQDLSNIVTEYVRKEGVCTLVIYNVECLIFVTREDVSLYYIYTNWGSWEWHGREMKLNRLLTYFKNLGRPPTSRNTGLFDARLFYLYTDFTVYQQMPKVKSVNELNEYIYDLDIDGDRKSSIPYENFHHDLYVEYELP